MKSLVSAWARWLAIASLALAAGGCPKQVKKTEAPQAYVEPELEFGGISFENQSFGGMEVVFTFELISKDERSAAVKACSHKLELEEHETVEGAAEVSGSLGKDVRLPIVSRIAIPWPAEASQVQPFLARKRMPYKLVLSCEIDAPGGPQKVSNSDSGSIPLPNLPEVDVLQANAERFGGGEEARVNFELGMVNSNPFNIHIEKIVYKVYLEDKAVTQGELVLAEVIEPSNEVSYDVATPIFSTVSDKEILQMLSKPNIEYRLEGAVHLSGFELPLDASGTISFPER
ncbi:MAG: LEA type 2 family protein [Deltaproteobacteria bacterium]|nr:LEA type 2 family protein [Deltaproteobacteria bacterium]